MEFSSVIIGILAASLGFVIAQFLSNKNNKKISEELTQKTTLLQSSEQQLAELKAQLHRKIEELTQKQLNSKEIEIELALWKNNFSNLELKLVEQKQELQSIQEQFKSEFKALAGEVLKEQSSDFKEKNEHLLQPFREQIKSFQETVRTHIDENIKNATSFKNHIDALKEMNLKISVDAQNLTKALKGDSKQQGNWGELILEKILEASELSKGVEYETQFSDNNIEGKRIQPDVIIRLPENKHLIIDSKVSLVAYERFVNAETNEEKEAALKEHLLSIRNHIKGLSEKNYPSAKSLNSPDFVLLFIPIESSFGVAIKEDISLFNLAWDKKIVLVSPSTLLATLKTVASIWKQEKQNRNHQAIAEESGKLYDKFVGLLEDLESIENNFNRAAKSFDEAKKKLSYGKGNIIGKIQHIKDLGITTQKKIDVKYLDNNED